MVWVDGTLVQRLRQGLVPNLNREHPEEGAAGSRCSHPSPWNPSGMHTPPTLRATARHPKHHPSV